MLGVACQGFFCKRRSLMSDRRVSLVKWHLKAAPAPDVATVVILWVRQFVRAAISGRAQKRFASGFTLEPKANRV